MTDESYKKAYEDAIAELDKLTEQKEAIERRMAKLKEIIATLKPFLSKEDQGFWQDVISEIGLKDACLEILRVHGKPITPSEVVRELGRIFRFDMSEYANPVAVVTTTLKRSKEVMEAVRPDGKKAYLIKTVEAIRNFSKEKVEAKRKKR